MRREIGFHRNALDGDQTRLVFRKQSARDGTLALAGGDSDRQQGLILAPPFQDGFRHVNAAFLRQHRRIHHIHRAHLRRQHTGQGRRRQRAAVQLCRMAFIFNADRLDGIILPG